MSDDFLASPEVRDRLEKLRAKYQTLGQDLVSYLDGLLYANSLTYWDYIHLDTLLSLQNPRTDFPDEVIFITYHQITELYFKLIQQELDQVLAQEALEMDVTRLRLQRVINYFRHLAGSFDVMTYGMDPQQFLKFRMALLPASGFQTAQYREIEFKLTDVFNLMAADARETLSPDSSPWEHYSHMYWKSGGKELESGKKTLTLKMFERQYDDHFLGLVEEYKTRNLYARYRALPAEARENEDLRQTLRTLDLAANVFWRLSHYKSAARYLQQDPEVIKATGGTNWQHYLPPRFQRVVFFPALWSEEERAEWGKAWVLELFQEQVEERWDSRMAQQQARQHEGK